MKKPITEQKSNTITTRITREEYETLKRLSNKLQIKRSDVIRKLIKDQAKKQDILPIDK